MNDELPLFQTLDVARSDADRALWLLAVPLSLLVTYQTAIRARCRAAGFTDGVDYVDLMMAVMRSVRGRDGQFADNSGMMLAIANNSLTTIVRADSYARAFDKTPATDPKGGAE